MIKLPETYKYMAVFLTMRCNLNCSYCLNAFDKKFDRKGFTELSGEQWVEALNTIESRPEVPVTFSGGEPFLHKDFIYIINHLKPELNIDILTNLYMGAEGINRIIEKINPSRLKRDAKYPSIRVSYHPEQMGNGSRIIENAKSLKEAGFSVGIFAVNHPSQKSLEAITQMQFRCADAGLLFRVKDFTGKYEGKDDMGRPFSITYGDYSRYPGAVFSGQAKECLCKTTELLMGPNGDVYRCHRDAYLGDGAIGNITSKEFRLEDKFRKCGNYGNCHACDVKLKTDYKQELGHTSVEIKF